jgi:hypothetical protein
VLAELGQTVVLAAAVQQRCCLEVMQNGGHIMVVGLSVTRVGLSVRLVGWAGLLVTEACQKHAHSRVELYSAG